MMVKNQLVPRLWGNKRYHTLNHYYRELFGEKVFKVSLDAGLTCPNRDGTVAIGGCIFCSSRGSGDFAGDRRLELKQQFREVRDKMHQKWPNAKYIGYFQAFSNTYAPAKELKEMYESILEEEGVVGLSIATRPDCLPDDVLDVLEQINKKTTLWVELGLQTIHEHTQVLINRAHDYQIFLEGVRKLRERNINVVVHIIVNLPGESLEEMMETAKAVAKLPIQGIKIHMLHLLKKTPLMKLYQDGKLTFMDKDTYIKLVVDILEILPPEMVIHRLTGDGPPDLLVEPRWTLKKWEVLNGIDWELERRNSWQGKYYQ
ncbi:TIGR01212 family radical SAM protein [Vulcanibacillus modesticaldus]|uniref:TIGR01212 family radical SAM protein n=1 Tax=Vulcanibacillus modesticaldus TaxID=337097 RepID=A0A1D2YVY4_9BACI|nr:TIGR01212 family radical SAM protein [Vulcanibacillus modesticaldus]OEF99890.1 TIGR01212 family radical SAM protein [Vulcanibacillus modesticaldus]